MFSISFSIPAEIISVLLVDLFSKANIRAMIIKKFFYSVEPILRICNGLRGEGGGGERERVKPTMEKGEKVVGEEI